MAEHEPWSVEISDDMDSMIEPMYEDDIETMIHEVKPEDVQHFDNKQFVRITDEQMPEILKFIDESDQYQFEDWAIIGETKGEDEESIPGSSEPPIDASSQQKVLLSTKAPGDAGAATSPHLDEEEGDEEEEEESEEEEENAEPNEAENSMVFSMFLSNWEDQVRQIREAKRLEWEQRMKGLLGDEGQQPHEIVVDGEKAFVDEDGDSWVLIDGDAPKSQVAPITNSTPADMQVAIVDSQVARRTGFFENWPSFNVGSKLGVVLAATGTSFAFGFMMGARAAMDSFYRLCERPLVAGVVGVTTAFAVSIQPTMLVTAVKYIILGGVIGGSAVATPVFVVGTTGVFVSAAVYHSWIAAKRGVMRAAASPSRAPASPASSARAIAVPLKMIAAHPNNGDVSRDKKDA